MMRSGGVEPKHSASGTVHQDVTLTRIENLSPAAVQIDMTGTEPMPFQPGQRIKLSRDGVEREFSLISVPDDPVFSFCIRLVPDGRMGGILAAAPVGATFQMSGPYGYFTYRQTPMPAVFVATGTGIAPFVSMVRSGIAGFTLLHGVSTEKDLYFSELFRNADATYIPCISRPSSATASVPGAFAGRVTEFLSSEMPESTYTFYLCGRGEMILDVINLVDERFSGSSIFSERFFS